jgi:hypothetical protein
MQARNGGAAKPLFIPPPREVGGLLFFLQTLRYQICKVIHRDGSRTQIKKD